MFMKYAGFWRQSVAVIIDQLIIAMPSAIIPEVYFYVAVANGADTLATRYQANIMTIVLMVVVFSAYYIYLNGRFGKTLGRKIMNTKLIRLDQPNRDGIGYGRAATRLVLFAIIGGFIRMSSIIQVPIFFGVIFDTVAGATIMWMLIDPRRRTLEDQLSGTAMVHDPVGRFLDFDPDRLPATKLRYASFGVMVVINAIASIFVALQR